MKRIGIFLGVEPIVGGMFQYAESLLAAACALPAEHYEVVAAHVAPLWAPVLAGYRCKTVRLKSGPLGLRAAGLAMAMRIPPRMARAIAGSLNPLAVEMKGLDCDAWVFPAQDAMAYQVDETVVASVHDLMHRYEPHFPEVSSKGRRAIRDHRFRSIVDHAAIVLVDSEVGRQQVVESYGADLAKIHLLPYVAPRQVVAAEERRDFDALYRLPGKFLFYPAQFWAHKNHDRLIDALAALLPVHPDIHLVCSGGKHHRYEQVQRRIRDRGLSGHVTFTGHVPDADLKGFYVRARGLIYPTFFGPTNIPPLEAFACGCAVATSGIYGMPEQVGDAAILFDPSSTRAIAEAMERLWTDDALVAGLRERGRKRAEAWGQPEFSDRFRVILESVWRGQP